MFVIKTYIALSGFAALSSAHMLLAQPKPFAGTQNGPLDATGSNFPCQMSSSGGVSTTLALGSMQPLAFTGQAVHGGGSCQVSVTYDTNPTKQSVWKVLHSIQGGCPAIGESANMGGDASAADPYTYQYPIPSNIPAGQATLAWSWLNRIGNREFYMNCASITLTGTGGPKSNWEALPDMVVANIPSINSCATVERKDYIFPNPGSSVENHPFVAGEVQVLDNCGLKAAANSSTGGSASASGSGSTPTTTASAKTTSTTLAGGVFITVATSAAANPTSTTVAGGVFATISASSSSGGAATTPVSSATATATAVASSAKPTTSASSGSSGSSSGSTVGAQTVGAACTDGAWACVGGTSYQRCGSGAWSVVMPLASGTKCTGASANSIDIIASGKVKRVARRFRS